MISASISGVGTYGAQVAAAVIVLNQDGDTGDVGLVVIARTIPLIALTIISGVISDRLPRHIVMLSANVICLSAQGTLALLFFTQSCQLWKIILLAALGGIGQSLFSPAAEGMLMATVHRNSAAKAFSFYRLCVQSSGVAGAAVGGVMISMIGPGWLLAAEAGTFALAGSFYLRLDTPPPCKIAARERFLSGLRAGWREVVTRPWLWGILIQFAIINSALCAIMSVFGPTLAEDNLGGIWVWGISMAAFTAGMAIGSVLMMYWEPRRMLFAGTVCAFPISGPGISLAIPLPVALLVIVMLLSGLCIEVFSVNWMTALHQEIPPDKLSRVLAYEWLGSVALLPAGIALAGPLERTAGIPHTLYACSVLMTLLTASVLTIPGVRRMVRRAT